MDKINEVLKRRVKALMIEKGISQADVARSIGELPQTFGNYVRGRTIPADLIRQWKKVYNEDLEELAETETETNVSRGTLDEPIKVMPLDVWDRLQRNFDSFEQNFELNKSEILFLREMVRGMMVGRNVDSNKV